MIYILLIDLWYEVHSFSTFHSNLLQLSLDGVLAATRNFENKYKCIQQWLMSKKLSKKTISGKDDQEA